MDKIQRGFGALVSPIDERDYPAGSYLATSMEFPENYMQDKIPEVTYDQYKTQKCVAYSLKHIVESFNIKEYDTEIPVSVDFIFCNRTKDQPSYSLLPFEGSYPKDLIHNLYRFGACIDSLCPTKQPDDIEDFVWLTEDMFANAEKYVIAMYLKVSTDSQIKSALMSDFGVTASIPVTPKFIGSYNELITQEYADKNRRGNHMIVIYGWKKYNNTTYWVCKNSYGDGWGDNGWFYLPVGYPMNEAWILCDKILPHWSDKYYKYLTNNKGIVFDERGYDLKATRGYAFKYMARALGYTGEDSYIDYWNYLNTKITVYEQRFDDLIKRSEVFAMLSRLKGISEPVTKIPPHWAEIYWNYLNDNGLIVYEKRYDDNITRAECTTLLARLLGFEE